MFPFKKTAVFIFEKKLKRNLNIKKNNSHIIVYKKRKVLDIKTLRISRCKRNNNFQQNVNYILLKINVKLEIKKLDLEYALGIKI